MIAQCVPMCPTVWSGIRPTFNVEVRGPVPMDELPTRHDQRGASFRSRNVAGESMGAADCNFLFDGTTTGVYQRGPRITRFDRTNLLGSPLGRARTRGPVATSNAVTAPRCGGFARSSGRRRCHGRESDSSSNGLAARLPELPRLRRRTGGAARAGEAVRRSRHLARGVG